eukprot:c12553_g1_i1.p1 GENE.c12553_g1_i1~~c12553_g1_i1.p1  ORF type:complete len:293 (+),score=100.48 c12553_g1_i1:15-893(+)
MRFFSGSGRTHESGLPSPSELKYIPVSVSDDDEENVNWRKRSSQQQDWMSEYLPESYEGRLLLRRIIWILLTFFGSISYLLTCRRMSMDEAHRNVPNMALQVTISSILLVEAGSMNKYQLGVIVWPQLVVFAIAFGFLLPYGGFGTKPESHGAFSGSAFVVIGIIYMFLRSIALYIASIGTPRQIFFGVFAFVGSILLFGFIRLPTAKKDFWLGLDREINPVPRMNCISPHHSDFPFTDMFVPEFIWGAIGNVEDWITACPDIPSDSTFLNSDVIQEIQKTKLSPSIIIFFV